MIPTDPSIDACLSRTRSAVLNVIIAAAAGIAASALILRWRDRGAAVRGVQAIKLVLLASFMVAALASHLVRRLGTSADRLRDPRLRAGRFYRAHVVSAIIASAAVPLGLVYGWFVRPQLDAVGPFWAAAIGLGLLAMPRAAPLQDFDEPINESSAPPQ